MIHDTSIRDQHPQSHKLSWIAPQKTISHDDNIISKNCRDFFLVRIFSW